MSTTSSVTTNLDDYAPGATAIITATGVDAGSTVRFEVDHVADPGVDGVFGTADDVIALLGGAGHDAWYVTDGGAGDLDGMTNGTVITTWYVNPDDSADERFLLTASTLSGWFASHTFTDAKPITGQGTPANPNNAGQALIEPFLVSSTAGTGVIQSIVKIGSNDVFEQGYNSDFRDVQFDETTAANFNRSITLAEIPVVEINGIFYREFDLDLNENNGGSNPLITLQTLMIFASDTNLLTGFDEDSQAFPAGTATLLFDMDELGDISVLLTDWNSGSGTGDYAFFIPVIGVGDLPGFADLSQGTYIYIYSEFGTVDGQGSGVSGGFEEWFVVSAPNPSMQIEKFATIEGDVADAAGDIINYTLLVSNVGNVHLTGVTVSDPYADPGSIQREADAVGDNDNILEIGEVWSYTATHTVTQAEMDSNGGGDGLLDNTATADSNETDPVTDTASIPVLRLPAMTIDKAFVSVTGGNGNDVADAAGDVLNYTVTVTNTGNVTLTGVTVVDPLTGQNISDVTLAPGASQEFDTSYELTQDDLDNRGGGDDDIDNTATADSNETDESSDSATVPLVYAPAMTIDKAFVSVTGGNGNDVADAAGDALNYTVTVTNTGNVTLTGVTVVDPLTGQNISDVTLAPGASQVYETSYTLTQDDLDSRGGGDDDIDNTATADSNETDESSDSETVPLVLNPAINIDKVTVYGATSGDGLTGITAGDAIGWFYTVTNTGNVALADVTVVDDHGTAGMGDDFSPAYIEGDDDGDGLLDVNETWTFSASGSAVLGTYTNVATAAGNSADGQSVSDADDSSYTAIGREALIAPTGTTPYQYISGTAQTFQEYYDYQGGVIQYSVKGGKINQTNPGVFFYFTGASGDIHGTDTNNNGIADDALTVKIDQTMTPDGTTSAFSPLNFNNVQVYKVLDDGDGVVDGGDGLMTMSAKSYQVSVVDGDVFVTFTPTDTTSMYIISVKYQTATVVGNAVTMSGGAYPTVNYQFDTVIGGSIVETYDGGVDLAPKSTSKMLLADEGGEGARAINPNQMKVLVDAAIAWWAAQGEDVTALENASVELADLGRDGDDRWILGMTDGDTITIDDDGAGHGWSTGMGGVAPHKVDLLSVLVHEMGHVLGMTDDDMGDMLAVGARMMPDSGDTAIGNLPLAAQLLGTIGVQEAEQHVNFS